MKTTSNEMTAYTKPITVRFPDSQYSFLKKRAKKGQTKISEVLRNIVLEAKERDDAESKKLP